MRPQREISVYSLSVSRSIDNCHNYRSHLEMVGDMSHVTLNFDLSKIPLVHF